MKILQVHNFYKQPGGEDKVLQQEQFILEKYGNHQVDQWLKSNDDLGVFDKFKLIFNTHWSKHSYRECFRQFGGGKYDIVHVHNFFPQFSPSIFKSFKRLGVPTVLTLHNYRLVHPNGTMFHKGRNDLDVLNSSVYKKIPERVYRNSLLQTAVVAHMVEHNKKNRTWFKYVDQFICLTNFQKQILVKGGLPEEKISVKPNFVSSKLIKKKRFEKFALFIGRFTEEKGVLNLIQEWIENEISYPLRLAGDGPLYAEILKFSRMHKNIQVLGRLSPDEVSCQLSKARILMFPSLWFEGFPMTILEAFAHGVPVISTAVGSQAEIIEEGVSGFKYEPGRLETVKPKIYHLMEHDFEFRALSDNVQMVFKENYTPEANYAQLVSIYQRTIEVKKRIG